MARLPVARRADLPTIEEQLVYDRVVGRTNVYRDEIRWTFDANYGVLLNSPKLALAVQDIGNHFRAWIPHAQRDLATIVAAIDLESTFVALPHLPNAVAHGVRVELVRALLRGTEAEVATDFELTLIRYVRQVAAGEVDDATFAAIESALGVRATVEATAHAAWVPAVIRMMQAFGLEQPPMSAIDEMLDRLERIPPGELLGTVGDTDYAWPSDDPLGDSQ